MTQVIITYNSSRYVFLFKRNLIRSLIKNGFSVTVVSPRDKYAERFHEIGVTYYPIAIDNSGLNPLKDLVLLINIFKAYKEINPDFNLIFGIKPNIYGTLVSHLLGIKTINNITGLGTAFLKEGVIQSISKFLYKHSLKFSSRVLFQNSEDKAFFVQQGLLDKNKATLIPGSGVDVDKFRPISNVSKEGFIFLMIGRVLANKGVYEYIEAAKLIKNQYTDVQFWLLGSCESDNRTSIDCNKVKAWELEGVITYFNETDDVRKFIAKSDVVVLPSYREGMPRALLEALSMERPIIGSNVPGCREIVNDGVNGYFCKVKDALDLSKQIEKMILLDQVQRKMMGKNGRIEIIKNFDEEIVIKCYIQLLKSFADDDF